MGLTLDQRKSLVERAQSITGIKPRRQVIKTDFDFFNYLLELLQSDISAVNAKAVGIATFEPDEVERETGRTLNGRKEYYKNFKFEFTASGNYDRAHSIQNLESDDSDYPIRLVNIAMTDTDGKGDVFEYPELSRLSANVTFGTIDDTTIPISTSSIVPGGQKNTLAFTMIYYKTS